MKYRFLLTTVAIGAALSKDGDKKAKEFLAAFDGPKPTVRDIAQEMSDDQYMVLFGRAQMEKRKEQRSNGPDKGQED